PGTDPRAPGRVRPVPAAAACLVRALGEPRLLPQRQGDRRDPRLPADVRGDLRLLPRGAAHRGHGLRHAREVDAPDRRGRGLDPGRRAVRGADGPGRRPPADGAAGWRRSIDVSLTSALVGDASSGGTKVSPLVPRFVRPGPFGAVMGKSLRYWRRDTRYLAALGIYPVILVFFAAMGLVLPESRPMMLGMAIFMCGMSGISLANEVGFDGPSGWVNIVTA